MLEDKVKKPFISKAVYLLLFLFLFTEGINDRFITNTVTNAIAVVLMVVLAIYALQSMKFSVGRFTLVFFLFLAICFLSVLWAENKARVYDICTVLLKLFILYALLENFVLREDNIDALILTICLCGIAYSIYYISQFGIANIFAAISSGVRLGGDIDHANLVGNRQALSTIACLWYAAHKNKKIMLLGAAISILCVLGTESRTAIGMCMLGVLLLLLIGQERSGFIRKFLMIAVIAVMAFLLLSSGMLAGVSERFDSMFSALSGGKGDGSSRVRILMVKHGWQQFLKTPLLGIGIGNTGRVAGLASPKYANGYLHNNYIELLVSVGLVGTLTFYSFFINPMKEAVRNWRNKSSYTVLSVVLTISVLFGQMGSVQYTKKFIYAYILLIMELCKYTSVTDDG